MIQQAEILNSLAILLQKASCVEELGISLENLESLVKAQRDGLNALVYLTNGKILKIEGGTEG